MDGEVRDSLGFTDAEAPELDLDEIMLLDTQEAQGEMIANLVSSAPNPDNIQAFRDELVERLKDQQPMIT